MYRYIVHQPLKIFREIFTIFFDFFLDLFVFSSAIPDSFRPHLSIPTIFESQYCSNKGLLTVTNAAICGTKEHPVDEIFVAKKLSPKAAARFVVLLTSRTTILTRQYFLNAISAPVGFVRHVLTVA